MFTDFESSIPRGGRGEIEKMSLVEPETNIPALPSYIISSSKSPVQTYITLRDDLSVDESIDLYLIISASHENEYRAHKYYEKKNSRS